VLPVLCDGDRLNFIPAVLVYLRGLSGLALSLSLSRSGAVGGAATSSQKAAYASVRTRLQRDKAFQARLYVIDHLLIRLSAASTRKAILETSRVDAAASTVAAQEHFAFTHNLSNFSCSLKLHWPRHAPCSGILLLHRHEMHFASSS
jgi:hypothetical protein